MFAGYGLQVPEAKHDDLAGLDLKGKVVLLLTGGPSSIPGPLLAHYQNTRWAYLKQAGAIGVISIQNPKGQDIPWERSKLARFLPSMAIADPALDETSGQQLAVTVNPATAEKFFEGTGHTFKELLALSNAGQVLPRFAVPASIRATVAVDTQSLSSDNVIGILPGTDPVLKNEYVVVSAHLDHLGVGTMAGDAIYNGAMDNASGVATLIEAAAAAAAKKGFKRSVIFAAVTAEEKGLLGSRYYANKPTVPASSLVANLNTDMFLPLFPLRSLVVQGLEESDLAADLRSMARPLGIEVYSDPEPERNAFTRSDQYSFIRTGVPSLSLKVGFTKGSPEHEMVKRWRTERYHAPSDDLAQPIDRQAAEDFNRVYVAVARSDREPADPARLEQRQLLQAVCTEVDAESPRTEPSHAARGRADARRRRPPRAEHPTHLSAEDARSGSRVVPSRHNRASAVVETQWTRSQRDARSCPPESCSNLRTAGGSPRS